MQLKDFIADEDAVSPVIGVILMVAITVILAAVIGTFVLGLGDQVSSSAPNAAFTFDWDGTTLTVTHDGGDVLENGATVEITKDPDGAQGTGSIGSFSSGASAGSQVSSSTPSGDETVRVTWKSESGDKSSTLAKWTGPNA